MKEQKHAHRFGNQAKFGEKDFETLETTCGICFESTICCIVSGHRYPSPTIIHEWVVNFCVIAGRHSSIVLIEDMRLSRIHVMGGLLSHLQPYKSQA